MTMEEAKRFLLIRYENAKDFSDPRWEAQERREHREYVEALRIAIEALSADVVQGFRGGKIPQNENILIHKAVAKAFEEGREKASDSYEDMIESTSQENIQLHERINALQTELEKSRKMYDELYEENEYIKDNMRRWIADMKGKING